MSHGDYAKAMKESIEMIVGKRENVYCIGLQANENGENLSEKLDRIDEDMNKYSECVVFCDLFGGTPCNTVIKKYLNNDKIKVISGMNFSMLLTTLLQEEADIDMIIDDGKKGIVDVKDFCNMDDRYD
ncbi:hypothetical protein UT300007_01050 [Clostridium sp. CTA-7]